VCPLQRKLGGPSRYLAQSKEQGRSIAPPWVCGEGAAKRYDLPNARLKVLPTEFATRRYFNRYYFGMNYHVFCGCIAANGCIKCQHENALPWVQRI
jgi:hypothetical protein